MTENRESFFARLIPYMPPSDLRQIEVAYMMAKYGHRAQTRKGLDDQGNPIRYFEHLRSVALILIDECDVRDWKLIVAGLLHDSLEDTKDITPEIIEHLFGPRVCQIVKLLSKCPKEGYLSRLQKYGDEEVLMIKAADRLANLRDMKDVSPEFIAKQVNETLCEILPVFRQFKSPAIAKLISNIESRCKMLATELAAQEKKNRFQEISDHYRDAPPLPPVHVVGNGSGLPDLRRR